MKRYLKISYLLLGLIMFPACEDYLNIPPEADISEKEIFGSYNSFQGFQDKLLTNLHDYNKHGARVTTAIGGEALSPSGQSVFNANIGNYFYLLENRGIWAEGENNTHLGFYKYMWESVRIANISLEKLETDILKNATQEQRDWLKGQALFFRGFLHYEFSRTFGSIPYVDKVYLASDEQDMKRYWSYEKNGKTYRNTQAVMERAVEDFEAAAKLLPSVYPSPNINWGRPTKQAALGFKAKALQFSASPLFNQDATGNANYDNELLRRCALACQEVIDVMRNEVVGNAINKATGIPQLNEHGLTPWEDFRRVFATFNGDQPGTDEVLFSKNTNSFGPESVRHSTARNFAFKPLHGQNGAQGSQVYLDKFEMNDGSRYSPDYDTDVNKRWLNRDKRFKFTFYVHGDRVHDVDVILNTQALIAGEGMNSNVMRKFDWDGVTTNNVGQAAYVTPFLRMADIYLTYAEAVFESTGSYTAVPALLTLSAADAVNIVRARADQPDVASTLPYYENNTQPRSCEIDADPAFRKLYRNERAVELAYEGVYWFDIRRWKRAHLKDGLALQALNFDVDQGQLVNFRRIDLQSYVFKEAHYWMPFRTSMTRFTTDWPQNPGW
jgi:starch-binding outer membrane protein, SusD/RagB family